MENSYNKQMLYIAAGLIGISIILFIVGFYSGSLMTAQAYQVTAQDSDSSIAVAGIDSGFPDEITTSEPPGAGVNAAVNAAVNTVIKPAIADEVQTNITPPVNDHISTALATERVYRNDLKQRKPEVNALEQSDNVNTQSARYDELNKHNDLYAIQVGSFSMEGNALGFSRVLSSKGYNPHIILTTSHQGTLEKQYGVLIGLFPSQEAAIKEAHRYTNKERVSAYVIPSPVWRVNKSRTKKTEMVKGVYIDYEDIKQHNHL